MRKIVVIEDDPDVILLIKDIFAQYNISATFFSSSVDAIREISTTIPDLVIMDLMMPNVSGFDISQKIRSDRNLKTTSILIITGYDSPKMRKQIFAFGIDDYLAKPFDVATFVQKVERFIK